MRSRHSPSLSSVTRRGQTPTKNSDKIFARLRICPLRGDLAGASSPRKRQKLVEIGCCTRAIGLQLALGMHRLGKLVQAYQQANELPDRLRIADEIYLLVGPAMKAFVLRHCPKDADDVYSATVGAIFHSLQTCKGKTDRQCWGWCYGVAWNVVKKQFRPGRSLRGEPMDPMEMDKLWKAFEASCQIAPASADDRLDFEYVLNLIRNAKPPCYDYLLDYSMGVGYRAMAVKYGVRVGTIGQRTLRCLELARELLAKDL